MEAHEGFRFRCFEMTGQDLVHAGGGREGRADSTQSLQCDPQRGVPGMSRLGGPLMASGWALWAPRGMQAARAWEAQESACGP